MLSSLSEQYDKTNICLGLIEYELNSLLVDTISDDIQFDLERYVLNILLVLTITVTLESHARWLLA